MKEYEIVEILHSGRKGKRGSPRTDGEYPNRIGRIVIFDLNDLRKRHGSPAFLGYVKDENGNDYSGKLLMTSPVSGLNWSGDKTLITVETLNSIFKFKEVANER